MRFKIVDLILLCFCFTFFSCATEKKGKTVTNNLNFRSAKKLIEISQNNNISDKGFYIKNGTADINTKSFSGKFDFSAKVNSEGNFFISCKGPLKIELLRIYGRKDSVYLIDRISKTVHCGKREMLTRKYNVPENFWNLLIGDIPETNLSKSNVRFKNDSLYIYVKETNYETKTLINTETLKADESDYMSKEAEISFIYKKLVKKEEYSYPQLIEINSDSLMFHVEIEIGNLVVPVNEEINIRMPGYKVIGL